MTRLFAAKRQIALEHLLHDVLVPDRTPHKLDPASPERDFKADIAHHGRDDRLSFQTAFRLKLTRAHEQHGIAIDDAPVVVGEDGTVAVAIERNAHLAASLHNRGRYSLRVGGP